MRRRSLFRLLSVVRWPVGPAAALASVLILNQAIAQTGLPVGFVYLYDIDPTIAQDIRYAGPDNFVGRPLPGYGAAECVLRRDVAEALSQVQADIAKAAFALKVYDCYRPARAVRAMAHWANDGKSDGATKRFFPKLAKYSLFASGYIAAQSAHSSGIAIDLTLIAISSGPSAKLDPTAHYGPCSGPVEQRSPDNSIDMGTGFDCFDIKSYTRSPAISADQRRSRSLLVAAMAKHGFRNYFREWWHFAYAKGPPAAQQDFPIPPRAVKTPR